MGQALLGSEVIALVGSDASQVSATLNVAPKYSQIEETMSPRVLETIAPWITNHAGRP